MASLLNASINCPPIFDGTNFSFWKCRMKSFLQSIDFDFWAIITDGHYVPSWRKDNGDIVTKTRSEYNQDDYEKLKKNSKVLYILQCAINDEMFNHGCSCETAKDLWEKLTLIYEETSEENLDSSRRENMFYNSNDENEITHLRLMANEGVEHRDTSDKDDDDDDDDDACTSDDEEEEEETEYDNSDEVYNFLNNCSRRKLLIVLLYYIKHQEGHISKIKDLKKMNSELSQENVEFRKSNDSLSNDLKSFQEKFALLEKEKDE